MKMEPDLCASLEEVRAQIDRIDRDIVRLIGERAHYVKAAARFKDSEHAVSAPERFAAMLQARRQWASDAGLSPDIIETIYRDLVTYFIEQEKQHWRDRQ
jgi:isochorismate pyruvate lyase